MRKSATHAFLVLSLVAVAIVALLAWRARSPAASIGSGALSRDESPQRSSTPIDSTAPTTQRTEVAAEPIVSQPEKAKTLRNFLRDYWGSSWPDVEKDLEASGKDLDRALEAPPPPWTEVQQKVGPALIKYQSSLNEVLRQSILADRTALEGEALGKRFGLDSSQVASLDVRGLKADLFGPDQAADDATDRYMRSIDDALMACVNRGWYSHAPFMAAHDGLRKGTSIHSGATTVNGWAICYVVTAEDFPELAQLRKEAVLRVKEREAALAAWIRDHTLK